MMRVLVAVCAALLLAEPATGQTTKKRPATTSKTSSTAETAKKKQEDAAAENSGTKTPAKSASKPATKTPAKAASKTSSPAAGAKKTGTATKKNGAASKKAATTDDPKKPATGTSKAAPEKPPQDNAGDEPRPARRKIGPNVTLNPEDLADFEKNPPAVQRLLKLGLDLTTRNLTYRYGSSDPSTGGMDCSGTIYYLLKAAGIKEPPRDSSGMYLWAQKEGTLRRVAPTTLKDAEMEDLQPGDLMFWEGTYEVQRDPPISHTMIYLGREKVTGMPVMIGASDGRTYGGVSRNGVSVFDFRLPRAESTAKFVGYARVPGLEHAQPPKKK